MKSFADKLLIEDLFRFLEFHASALTCLFTEAKWYRAQFTEDGSWQVGLFTVKWLSLYIYALLLLCKDANTFTVLEIR